MAEKRRVLSVYELGDMKACYVITEGGCPELILFPGDVDASDPDALAEEQSWSGEDGLLKEEKRLQKESLVQAKLTEDDGPAGYACGTTMRNSRTVLRMGYDGQERIENKDQVEIRTRLRDERGLSYLHFLTWRKEEYSLESYVMFENRSEQSFGLDMLSSFSLRGFTAFAPGDGHGQMKLHRIRSRWSSEGRLVTDSPENLQLEPSWSEWSVNSERYGQIGSMPVKGYFPFGAVEDTKEHIVWAAQLATESSWQMEFYRRDDDLAFSGGLADWEFGHWRKEIEPGETFETPHAILTVVRGELDEACQRLTYHGKKYLKEQPESEAHLPVLFNEYCTTWGLPSHENIHGILQALQGHGIEYFVVDAGWFVEEGKSWGDGMGDYIPSPVLFPEGLTALTKEIREAGMKPGIWFEIDNAGRDSRIYHEEEMLLHKDGRVLTNGSRRFFAMTKPEVIRYLGERVIGQLKQYGFSYLKMDYNETIGVGCDGAKSPGEGLRQDREASVEFVRKIRREVPGIILENCSSGGHKLEPLMMSLCSMASFSDAHEAAQIPVIALRLHRSILPAQSQIWAVIRQTDSLQRIVYTMAATFLGRMCLSGDVTNLSQEQWKMIDDGIAFYRLIAPVIKDGYSYLYEHRGESDRHLTGWQALVRVRTREGEYRGKQALEAFAVVHVFAAVNRKELVIELPEGCPRKITSVYRATGAGARTEDGKLIIATSQPMEAIAVYLE